MKFPDKVFREDRPETFTSEEGDSCVFSKNMEFLQVLCIEVIVERTSSLEMCNSWRVDRLGNGMEGCRIESSASLLIKRVCLRKRIINEQQELSERYDRV